MNNRCSRPIRGQVPNERRYRPSSIGPASAPKERWRRPPCGDFPVAQKRERVGQTYCLKPDARRQCIDDAQPFGIVAGADGNLWFTEQLGNEIGASPQRASSPSSSSASLSMRPQRHCRRPRRQSVVCGTQRRDRTYHHECSRWCHLRRRLRRVVQIHIS